MKSILFLIFIIISFSEISSKRYTLKNIFKRSKSYPLNVQTLQYNNRNRYAVIPVTVVPPISDNSEPRSRIQKKPQKI